MERVIRTTPLTTDEKKELTNLMDKLKLALNLGGQTIIHWNQGQIVAIEPRPMLR